MSSKFQLFHCLLHHHTTSSRFPLFHYLFFYVTALFIFFDYLFLCFLRHYVTPAIRIRQRPCHPGSPDVLSANGSLHFGRYSEACNGRVERFLCQVQVYFRSYYSGFYPYVLAFSKDLPTLYIAWPTTKRHFAGD